MTPIQQHEQELRAMMERAGLVAEVRVGPHSITGVGTRSAVTVYAFRWVTSAVTHAPNGDIRFGVGSGFTAEHHDPRIALRHCLEMAGLLVDRPPVTDEALREWLTERHGEGVRMGHVTAWARAGIRMFHGESTPWVRGDGKSFEARELGAILWCAERWTEAQP